MLFNSTIFAIFLPIVFVLYWFVTGNKLWLQNLMLLCSSYIFYGWWDWRFLFLLLFSTLLDYFSGIKIHEAEKQSSRKFWLILSVVINLGFLGFFKYYNFFAVEFATLLRQIGFSVNEGSFKIIQIILPVGISFYTFHGLSYIIDIYKRRIPAVYNFPEYALFVSYFPLLVAGPIERATHLLPQIQRPRVFNKQQAVNGLRQILWGLFKKVVIADTCATYANLIFNNSVDYNGSTLFLGAVFFAFQIYGDFSGYSDIALGVSKLFGMELLRNFSFPYFSRDIAEFWRRWHISLSTWFRDYLYIPLGGSKGGTWMKVRNTFIIFLVSGFWHGANWTFIVWGLLNALYFIPLLISSKNRNHLDIVAQGKAFPTITDVGKILVTFILTVIAWIFFRSTNLSQAWEIVTTIFSPSFFQPLQMLPKQPLLLISFFMMIEWVGREHHYGLEQIGIRWPKFLRWSFFYLLVLLVFIYSGEDQAFIYFQF
ncbi:MBOAT family O-acyltransferase [Lacibacter sp.]|uniref:MBOAT family O-acyltransferase n=1 Tax=Lacibacter sp. TaxID=1915409 RepID=UPI002B4B8D88|nr:MBOAT family O-acyltransferase [Lacibacter sp.]HLP36088.1 MBOAT family O-acyltransferase [Lacibacter sp.]